MRTMKHLLAILLLVGASSVLTAGACEDGVCGPCGKLAYGDATISGDARLDGIFKAVGTLGTATATIKSNFDANVQELAAVFMTQAEIDASLAGGTLVADLKTKINAEISANVEGGLKVVYKEPKCSANVDVSVQASAQCEAKVDANCSADVQCSGPDVSFACEGKCEGSCEGTCDVPTCTVEASGPTLACEGECQASCAVTLDVAAACEGKCEGTCSGDCSAYVENASGEMECSGTCSGDCQGKCEVSGEAAVNCQGECRGSCKLTGPTAEANCTGELKCEGNCEGSCSGGCEGKMTAPSCEGQAECNADASAKCDAQASAQASASLECTPPSLEIGFDFNASVAGNAEAQAAFLAKMDLFKVKMIAILQGMKQLKILLEGDAELGIQAPHAQILAEVNALVSAGFDDFDVPAGLLPCVLPAFQEAVTILGSVAGDMTATLQGQADLSLIIIGG